MISIRLKDKAWNPSLCSMQPVDFLFNWPAWELLGCNWAWAQLHWLPGDLPVIKTFQEVELILTAASHWKLYSHPMPIKIKPVNTAITEVYMTVYLKRQTATSCTRNTSLTQYCFAFLNGTYYASLTMLG